MEDVWRGEVQDLLSQITQLQAENKGLLVSLSLKESPVTEEDLQKQEGRLSAATGSSDGFLKGCKKFHWKRKNSIFF